MPQPAGRRSPVSFPGGQPKVPAVSRGRRPFVPDALTGILVVVQGFGELLGGGMGPHCAEDAHSDPKEDALPLVTAI